MAGNSDWTNLRWTNKTKTVYENKTLQKKCRHYVIWTCILCILSGLLRYPMCAVLSLSLTLFRLVQKCPIYIDNIDNIDKQLYHYTSSGSCALIHSHVHSPKSPLIHLKTNNLNIWNNILNKRNTNHKIPRMPITHSMLI